MSFSVIVLFLLLSILAVFGAAVWMLSYNDWVLLRIIMGIYEDDDDDGLDGF